MSDIPLFGTLAPNPGGTAPLARAENIIGAFTTFLNATERNLIPATMLREGELCMLADTNVFYRWTSGAWVAFAGFGGGGGSSIVDWKESVRFATTTALPASTRSTNTRTANSNGAFPAVDGVTAAVGNRFLDKDHATGADRGIWTITSLGSGGAPWVIARASDADTSAEVTAGMGCVVTEGTANGGKIFLLTTADPIVLNTTALTFTALSVGGGSGGGGIGSRLTYDTSDHVDTAPPAGAFKTDNGTLGAATKLWVSTTDYDGVDITNWLEQLDDYVGNNNVIIRLQSRSNPAIRVDYRMTADVVTATGYRKISVAYKTGPAGLLSTAGDVFMSVDMFGLADGDLNGNLVYNAKGYRYAAEIATTGATPAVNFSTGDLQKTTLSANATPTFTAPVGVGYVTWHAQQNGTGGYTITFPGSVVGSPPQPAAGANAHTFYVFFFDGTNYHFIRRLREGAAAGQQLFFDGTSWLLVGTLTGALLADASVTLQFSTAPQYIWPASVDTAAGRNLTLGTTGLAAGPMAGQGAVLTILFLRASYTNAIAVKNNAAATIFTLPAALGKPVIARFYYDTTALDWALSAWEYLGTVTAA